MEEALTSLIIFWYMGVKTVKYLVEMHVSESSIIVFPRKTLAWSISNSNNHMKKELML